MTTTTESLFHKPRFVSEKPGNHDAFQAYGTDSDYEFATTPVPMFGFEEAAFEPAKVATFFDKFLPKGKEPPSPVPATPRWGVEYGAANKQDLCLYHGGGYGFDEVFVCFPPADDTPVGGCTRVTDIFAEEAVECGGRMFEHVVNSILKTVTIESCKARARGDYTRPLLFESASSDPGPDIIHARWAAEVKRLHDLHQVVSLLHCRDKVPGEDWGKWDVKLQKLRAKPEGWDPTCGPLPSEDAIANAAAFLTVFRQANLEPSRLSATVVGGVGITFKRDARKVYVEFRNTGTVHALYSDGSSDPRVEKVPPDNKGYSELLPRIKTYLNE